MTLLQWSRVHKGVSYSRHELLMCDPKQYDMIFNYISYVKRVIRCKNSYQDYASLVYNSWKI
jgi:hypothetical protein